MRQTRAEIDLNALTSNYNLLKSLIGDRIKISAVIKGNAYGHGIVQIAKTLEDLKIGSFSIAYTSEGEILRKAGIKTSILLIGPVCKDDFEDVKNYNLKPIIYDFESLANLSDYASKNNLDFTVHLKMDSGMSRLGFRPNEISRLIECLKTNKKIKIEGISSHFLESENKNSEITQAQHLRFMEFAGKLESSLGFKALKHIANSAAAIASDKFHPDMVRCGLALYGYSSLEDPEITQKLKRVLTLKSNISTIKKVSKGDYVGYSRGFIADRDYTIAIIPVGYADGFLRKYSSLGYVLIDGKKCPIIGHICMDMTFCDVSSLSNPKAGDDVILLGKNADNEISAVDYAKSCNTIPYEILTAISERVPRVFLNGDKNH